MKVVVVFLAMTSSLMADRQLIWETWEAKCSACAWKMIYDPRQGVPGLPRPQTEATIRQQFQAHNCEDFLEKT